MTAGSNTLRALITYGLVLPLALMLGVILPDMWRLQNLMVLLLVVSVLAFPLLMKWHHPLLILTWNMTAVVFFLPGRPSVWLVMGFVSLALSLVQRALVMQMRFVRAPSVVLPVVFLAAVVLLTGKLTGGFGMRLFGSELAGGKRYLLVFAGIVGFFAMMAHRIPERKAHLYVGLFFLGGLAAAVSTFIPYLWNYWPRAAVSLAAVFPVNGTDLGPLAGLLGANRSTGEGVSRFYGLTLACSSFFCYLLARYGVRELLAGRKIWRFALLSGVVALGALSGFRSYFILMVMTFAICFWMEGLVRTRYAMILFAAAGLAAMLLVPYANKLPMSIQRTLSFLPLEIEPVARYSAEGSTEWRKRIWLVVLPEVPQYLWLGKGLSVDVQQLDLVEELERRGRAAEVGAASILAGDYHNGPLTLIVPFGIWGVLGWIWFLLAALRALYLNYRYGEESLRRVNAFLFAYFLAKTIQYFFVFGNFYTDFADFMGLIGFGLALNGGVLQGYRRPWVVKPVTLAKPRPPRALRPVPAAPGAGAAA